LSPPPGTVSINLRPGSVFTNPEAKSTIVKTRAKRGAGYSRKKNLEKKRVSP